MKFAGDYAQGVRGYNLLVIFTKNKRGPIKYPLF